MALELDEVDQLSSEIPELNGKGMDYPQLYELILALPYELILPRLKLKETEQLCC